MKLIYIVSTWGSIISFLVAIWFLIQAYIFSANSTSWRLKQKPTKWKWYYGLFISKKHKNELFNKL